jgi:tetratricopeptide repeat protein
MVVTHAVLLVLLAWGQAESTSETPQPPQKPSVFELPRIQARFAGAQAQLATLLKQQKYAEAEAVCQEMGRLIPHDANGPYNLACVLAHLGKLDEAVAALDRAVSLGFNDVKHLQTDDDLAPLRDRDDFKQLLAKAATAKPDPAAGWNYTAEPAAIEKGVGLVSEKNVAFDPRVGLFAVLFKFGAPQAETPAVKGFGEAGALVQKWFTEGTAAGNHGDLYDNHDHDHSNMDYDAFPQLTRVEFDEAAKKRTLDHGLQLAFLYNAPTIGNSSTAHVHGVFWRCQGRFALLQPRGPEALALQYANNQLYFYPEHRDHDPGHNGQNDGYGDVLPANTPYLLLSQGSSGSDRPLMHAVALIMAALQPEVKAELVRQHALMPTIQYIFRWCYPGGEKAEDYLTGKAHPTVFEGDKLDLVRLVTMAHELTLKALPPLAQVKMVQEDQAVVGIDYFDVADRERIFDTPGAIARVVKSTRRARRMVVSAKDSRDLNEQPLKHHFVVLRGDPGRISIKPLEDGSSAEIVVQHHDRRPVLPGSHMESNRVDIGVFVQNDKHFSAPAFISLTYLDNQKRVYDEAGRIKSVDYADAEMSKNYVDPLLDFQKNWRDDYHYDDVGQLLGWTRSRGDQVQQFTFDGCLVTRSDDKDRPLEAKVVRYVAKQSPGQAGALEQLETDEAATYEYAGDSRVGKRVK